eukprot:EG_transcript_38642
MSVLDQHSLNRGIAKMAGCICRCGTTAIQLQNATHSSRGSKSAQWKVQGKGRELLHRMAPGWEINGTYTYTLQKQVVHPQRKKGDGRLRLGQAHTHSCVW